MMGMELAAAFPYPFFSLIENYGYKIEERLWKCQVWRLDLHIGCPMQY